MRPKAPMAADTTLDAFECWLLRGALMHRAQSGGGTWWLADALGQVQGPAAHECQEIGRLLGEDTEGALQRLQRLLRRSEGSASALSSGGA